MADVIVKTLPVFIGPVIRRWLWTAALAGYAFYFAYLVISGNLENLVSPRMTVFVVIGILVLALIVVAQVRQLLSGKQTGRLPGGLVLLFTPFAFLLFVINSNGSVIDGSTGVSLEGGGPHLDLTTKLQKAVNPFLPDAKPAPVPANGPISSTGPIVLDKNNYYAVYQELYSNPAAFEGRSIHATGFVFPHAGGNPNEFITARELMWCCAADAVGIGFITSVDSVALPARSAWVTVDGTIGSTTYIDQYTQIKSRVPLIHAKTVKIMKGPDFVFAYPK